jgi:ketosteroid isomerase-like protein
MELGEPVATYYRAIDEDDYGALREVLAPGFVQHRPDRTFQGRSTFVRFMRDDRPNPDTTHELDANYGCDGEVAVRGRVLSSENEVLVRFVDVFTLTDGQIDEVWTYTR